MQRECALTRYAISMRAYLIKTYGACRVDGYGKNGTALMQDEGSIFLEWPVRSL